jgi:Holliday junction DNA helicase RuvA
MIASVRGPVRHLGLDRVVIEVGGVGMLLHTTPATASALHLGQEALLATTLVVREDSLTLYAFTSDDERDIFEQVQTVSGVGPRIALAMLSVLAPDRLRAAVTSADLATLTKVPGIGKKGAERIVLELRDRIGAVSTGADGVAGALSGGWQEQVRQGVIALGWSAQQADQAVAAVAESVDGETPPVPVLLRQAIRLLGRTR